MSGLSPMNIRRGPCSISDIEVSPIDLYHERVPTRWRLGNIHHGLSIRRSLG